MAECVEMGKMRKTSKSSGSCRPPPFLRNPLRTGFASTTLSFPSTLLDNLITVGTILSFMKILLHYLITNGILTEIRSIAGIFKGHQK